MHPLMVEALVQEHIEDLQREAAMRRLARRGERQARPNRRRTAATQLQRAPAH